MKNLYIWFSCNQKTSHLAAIITHLLADCFWTASTKQKIILDIIWTTVPKTNGWRTETFFYISRINAPRLMFSYRVVWTQRVSSLSPTNYRTTYRISKKERRNHKTWLAKDLCWKCAAWIRINMENFKIALYPLWSTIVQQARIYWSIIFGSQDLFEHFKTSQ